MALTINQIMTAARDINSPYANQVMGALILHADWQRQGSAGENGRTAATVAFAQDVLNAPDAYTFRFAARCGLNPTIRDNQEDINTVPDSVVIPLIEQYFPRYAPEVAS